MKPIACNLCTKKKFKTIFAGSDLMYQIKGNYPLVFCSCGLLFLNPQPEPNDLARHYPSHYYSISGKPLRNKRAEFIYKTYFSDEGNRFLRVLLYPIYPLIRGTIIKKNAKLLDIGCGNGTFLMRMKLLGMQVFGIDPYISHDIPKLHIRKAHLTEAPFPKNSFDIITLNNVLEHMLDPTENLRLIYILLAPEGKAIIAVPNINSVLFKIFGKYWSELDIPRHVFFFNEKTLSALCQKNGLQVTHVRYNSIPFGITGSIFYFLNSFSKTPKKLDQSKLVSNQLINFLLLPLCHLFNLFKIGDRLEITVVKQLTAQPAKQ